MLSGSQLYLVFIPAPGLGDAVRRNGIVPGFSFCILLAASCCWYPHTKGKLNPLEVIDSKQADYKHLGNARNPDPGT